jgi:hypothetical protein
MDLLPLNAFTVFLAIATVGFLFLMVSLFFGEIFEHFDTSLDHDLDHGGPGFFSPRVMSVFVTTFGGAGAIATFYGWSPVPASVVGFGSGVALSSLVLQASTGIFGAVAAPLGNIDKLVVIDQGNGAADGSSGLGRLARPARPSSSISCSSSRRSASICRR